MHPTPRSNQTNRLWMPFIAALLSARVFAADCTVSDIKLESIEARPGDISTRVLGRVINQCATPVGVEIKLVFYGTSDKLLMVEDVWPASTKNIPARSAFPFDIRLPSEAGFQRVEAQVLRVKRW